MKLAAGFVLGPLGSCGCFLSRQASLVSWPSFSGVFAPSQSCAQCPLLCAQPGRRALELPSVVPASLRCPWFVLTVLTELITAEVQY